MTRACTNCLCLADYFVLTVGQQAADRFGKLEAAGENSGIYFVRSLAVRTADKELSMSLSSAFQWVPE